MQNARFCVKNEDTNEVLAEGEDVVSTVKDVRIKDIDKHLVLVDCMRGRKWRMQYDGVINGIVMTEPNSEGESAYISLEV